MHPIGEDGVVGGPTIEWRETANKAHCVMTDASNKFAFLPHVDESNAIFQFQFDENTGALTPNASVPVLAAGEGEGPRHYVFHPNIDVLYTSNEQGCSVTAYNFDSSAGTLVCFPDSLDAYRTDFDEENSCAQIHITPNGKFVYVSNRGT